MTTVIAIAVVEHQHRFLVGKRPVGVRFAGYDEFPGGKTNEAEQPEAAAERECLEETGLAVVATHRLLVVEDQAADLLLHFIACRLDQPTAIPTAPFQWIPIWQLADCLFPPANAPVVELLLKLRQEQPFL
jgi:8-oxo-dGTP diphosphatase